MDSMRIVGQTPIQVQRPSGPQNINVDSQVFIQEAKAGSTLAEIKAATKNNKLDEIVVKDQQGKYHVIFADELVAENGHLPEPSAKVKLDIPGLSFEEEVEVVHVDSEDNRSLIEGIINEIDDKVVHDLMTGLYENAQSLSEIFGDVPQALLEQSGISRKDFDRARGFQNWAINFVNSGRQATDLSPKEVQYAQSEKANLTRVRQALGNHTSYLGVSPKQHMAEAVEVHF